MKINCVILNYNDADTVLGLVGEIRGYQAIDRIVIVDNASTDDSWEKLQALAAEKVDVLRSEKNGGYGSGNNLGIRHAVNVNEADHVLIANPDVKFSEDCVKALSGVLKRHPELAVAAALMEDETFGDAKNGWKLHGFWGELFAMGPISRRVFKKWLNYPASHFEGKKAAYVDAVHGSMLMVDGRKFLEAGGYDEGIFLYQEETVLASRFKKLGFKTVLLLNQKYRHEHSVSISKSFQGQIDRQKLRNTSVLYYLENYLAISPVKQGIAKLWFALILLEIRVAGILGAAF
ncbi:MAG: glycosyltransferase family 2 protein [Lachnospiraceae bacterium]|nr:glycosyltransferase family 2 protein [Lachnospiraceae bacterium]